MLGLLLAGHLAASATMAPLVLPSVPVSNVSHDHAAVARQLVDLVNSDDALLTVNMRGWEAGVRAAMANDPALSNLERDYPGAIEAGVTAGRPIAIEYLKAVLPGIKRIKVDAVASQLSTPEISEAIAFFSSPVGLRFSQSLAAKSDVGTLAKDVIARADSGGSLDITEQDSNKLVRSAVRSTMSGLSSTDTIAILKFEQTATAKKISAVTAEADRKILQFVNNPDPALMKRQGDAIIQAILAFAEAKKTAP